MNISKYDMALIGVAASLIAIGAALSMLVRWFGEWNEERNARRPPEAAERRARPRPADAPVDDDREQVTAILAELHQIRKALAYWEIRLAALIVVLFAAFLIGSVISKTWLG
jgi:hypothetical protein